MQGLGRFASRGRESVFGIVVCRHCERSEAIHLSECCGMDCFAALAMTSAGGNSLHANAPHTQRHHPRKRVNQYSRASVMEPMARGVLGPRVREGDAKTFAP